MNKFLLSLFLGVLLFSCKTKDSEEKKDTVKPNIIVIYVDDLGYGDVGCYGATGVETPAVDKLAANGLKMEDAHCSASTCTPSRFSLLTGMYAFRNKAAILPGDAPLLIRPGTPTLPGMLQKAGYKTGVVGKWHLGLGDGAVNWNEAIKPGPLEIGFDYSFLIPATGDRVPTVFVEDHHVVGLDANDPIKVSYSERIDKSPNGWENKKALKQTADLQHSCTIVDSISRIGYMTGGLAARWKDAEFPDVLTGKAKDFIRNNKDNPFFLYFAYHDIHVPRVPNKRFQGKTTMGPRGDAIAQMDWCTGEIVNQLEELGIAENTIIVFSSDNGPVLDDGYDDNAVALLGEHKPGGVFRGGKYSIYEAGTRVPTIVYWPGTIKPGVSKAMFNHVDLYASFAKLVNQPLAENDALDSQELLDVVLGKTEEGRSTMLYEAFVLGVRKGDWKYFDGGTTGPDWLANKDIETGLDGTAQLYNLKADISEQNDLIKENTEKAEELKALLDKVIKDGRTRVHVETDCAHGCKGCSAAEKQACKE